MATPFTDIRLEAGDAERSANWYMRTVRNVASGLNEPNEVFGSDLGEYTQKLEIGQMYAFRYNPKHKQTLPYYDTFPLVIISEPLPTGFSGINLHYIPPLVRARLLGKLMEASDLDIDIKSKLRSQWGFIRNFSRYPEIRGAVKKYLTSQVSGRIYKVNPLHWKSAIFLDTQQFIGAQAAHIYRENAKRPERKRKQL